MNENAEATTGRRDGVRARRAVAEWGRSDAVFVDGTNVQKGTPPSYEKIHKLIAKRIRA